MSPQADSLMTAASGGSAARSRTRDLGLSRKLHTSGWDSLPRVNMIRPDIFQFFN